MFVCACVCVVYVQANTHPYLTLPLSFPLYIHTYLFLSLPFFCHKADRAGNDNGRRMLPDPYDGPTIPLSQQHRYVCVRGRGEMNKFGVVLQHR